MGNGGYLGPIRVQWQRPEWPDGLVEKRVKSTDMWKTLHKIVTNGNHYHLYMY